MERGDFVTIALSGDVGRPDPATVMQADQFDQTGTVTILLVSGTLVDAPFIGVTVEPTSANGLRNSSQIMVDKAMSAKRDRVGVAMGHFEAEPMMAVTRPLAVFMGIA